MFRNVFVCGVVAILGAGVASAAPGWCKKLKDHRQISVSDLDDEDPQRVVTAVT